MVTTETHVPATGYVPTALSSAATGDSDTLYRCIRAAIPIGLPHRAFATSWPTEYDDRLRAYLAGSLTGAWLNRRVAAWCSG
jgi:hypothetical protein